MLARFRVTKHCTGAREIRRINQQFTGLDRKLSGQCRLYGIGMTRINADRIATTRIDARLMESIRERHFMIDQE